MSPRPAPEVFARQMFEIDLEQFINNSDRSEILFFDRSFLDSAFLIQQNDKIYFEKIRSYISTHQFNRKVFLAPPWKEIYTNDSERDQTFEESVNIYESLRKWYLLSGYEPIMLPRLNVEKRMAFIWNELK